MKRRTITWYCLALLVFGGLLTAQSEELKARFLQRKPAVDQLKNAGIVGENNAGLLEFRNPAMRNGENDALVNAENADRQAVYADIAQRTGTTAQEVGKRRALQIAQLAAPGHWLQAADGRWYQK